MAIVEKRVDVAVVKRNRRLNDNKTVLFEGHFHLSEEGGTRIYNSNIYVYFCHYIQLYFSLYSYSYIKYLHSIPLNSFIAFGRFNWTSIDLNNGKCLNRR